MQWGFWQRGRRRQEQAAKAAEASQPEPIAPLPLSMVREVLALQQLVGNQAVLRMIAPKLNGAQPRAAK